MVQRSVHAKGNMMGYLTSRDIKIFRQTVYDFYTQNRRSFSWREHITPYRVFISEIMLQQTQTYRVEKKFETFIASFPSFELLSQAALHDVLRAWQGLGYNRRALALQKSARVIMATYGGYIPNDPNLLMELPGIGPATAASIVTFAYNKPTVFIETNIRSVFLHHFFNRETGIADKELVPLVRVTLDKQKPREWYYALMDYGVMLKQKHGNPSRSSAHHIQQKIFHGSDRHIRGIILRLLTQYGEYNEQKLYEIMAYEHERIQKNIRALEQEGFLIHQHGILRINDYLA